MPALLNFTKELNERTKFLWAKKRRNWAILSSILFLCGMAFGWILTRI